MGTPKAARHPKIDCFYVYPTVSDQKTPNASLRIDPEERSIALYQAARYSQHCRVFAPMYRQATLAALLGTASGAPAERNAAYNDVRNAWRTYLRKYNKGRGVVLDQPLPGHVRAPRARDGGRSTRSRGSAGSSCRRCCSAAT